MGNGILIVRRKDRFFIRYDAGALQIAMREEVGVASGGGEGSIGIIYPSAERVPEIILFGF